jgi:hypothetical protein
MRNVLLYCWLGRVIARVFAVLLSVVFACALVPCARAIVDANSAANTNAPADGAPWQNVGTVIGGASTVYIGNGWALTAVHAGVGNIELNGSIFNYDGTSYTRMTNSDGTGTDMVMFHLTSIPNVPPIAITSNTPSANTQVDMIGYGHYAGSAQTNLVVGTGFYWSATGAKSWGNNKVDVGGTVTVDAGYGTLTAFKTTFDQLAVQQTSDEAQPAAGDSGGGVFQNVNSTWKLVGMINYTSDLPNQTNNTAVFGDTAFYANVATYRTQILATASSTAPVLRLVKAGSNYLVSWPNIFPAYNLQSTTTLLNTNSWVNVGQSQVVTNGSLQVTVPGTATPTFFRLRKVGA